MKNVNMGVLGHVDCGKTSLCKVLSTTGSTAAFDSNPQSKERGITLDLGFSSFKLGEFNFTLVDCPGHSSLIRTVIGGAQIMDLMLLVIDINKGMQPQTAECLILAQITSDHLIVALNKVDVIPQDQRGAKITKVTKLMRSTLSKTKFGDAPIVSVSASDPSIGTNQLKSALLQKVETIELKRDIASPFLMAIDHCFSIKGQGTVLTGTVLQGLVKINDTLELPSISEQKKVKSMQSFRVPVNEAKAGDRVGICVPGLDPSLIERTLICAPKLVYPSVRAGIITIEPISFFKKPIVSKRKYHISMGYETITARLILFRTSEPISAFDPALDYEYVEELSSGSEPGTNFALLEFDTIAMTTPNPLIIGSDLQQSGEEGICRLAFCGRLINLTQDKQFASTYLPTIKIFREKVKQGTVHRILSENVLIVKGFCKKESKIEHLVNLKVSIELEDDSSDQLRLGGRIESRFGLTVKVRVVLNESMSAAQSELLKGNLQKAKVVLRYKRYVYSHENEKNKLIQ